MAQFSWLPRCGTTWRRTALLGSLLYWMSGAAIGGGGIAQAQVPTNLDPRGAAPAPAPAPAAPQPAPTPQPIIINSDGQQIPPPEDDGGWFYVPDDFAFSDGDDGGGFVGQTPTDHEVRQGDTLWDISFFYFNNPWEWPKVWSYNPDITNPHWIFPGDRVRLYPEGQAPSESLTNLPPQQDLLQDPEANLTDEVDGPATGGDVPVPRTLARTGDVRLRQLAFIDEDTRRYAATIDGAVEDKTLLVEGDSVYIAYPSERPLQVGQEYAIYTETSTVRHPDSGRNVGTYARILGQLRVVSAQKDKRARAFITDSTDVIERGARVGPLQRTYRTVAPTRNQVELQGTVVAMFGSDQLIGQNQVVFIDKGESDNVRVGNRLFVVRRGDALSIGGPTGNDTGKDDRRFPARAIGEVLVVQVGKRASAAIVTLALQEIGIGDAVLMRKSR